MIIVGDIVFRKYKGGFRNNKPHESSLGLVIKEHKEKGTKERNPKKGNRFKESKERQAKEGTQRMEKGIRTSSKDGTESRTASISSTRA